MEATRNVVTKPTEEAWVDQKEIARLYGVSEELLERDRITRRIGIPYIKVGRVVRYRPSQVHAHLEARRELAAA